MAKEPGNLSDLEGQEQQEWDDVIRRYFQRSQSTQLLPSPDARTPDLVPVDWGAYPVRVERCLQSRSQTNRLLDWRTSQGDVGRAQLQEEYFEWREVREPGGKIRRVEMTTEFRISISSKLRRAHRRKRTACSGRRSNRLHDVLPGRPTPSRRRTYAKAAMMTCPGCGGPLKRRQT